MEENYIRLKAYMEQKPFADGESVLEMLYEYYNEHHPYDDE